AQVAREDADRVEVGAAPELGPNLRLDLRQEQALASVRGGQPELLVPDGAARHDLASERLHRFLEIGTNLHGEERFPLAAEDRQHPMRRDSAHRLTEVVVVAEFALDLRLAARRLGEDAPALPGQIADPRAPGGLLRDALRDDVARPSQRLLD